ncbi:hypothetical protein [Streptomyces tricolor]
MDFGERHEVVDVDLAWAGAVDFLGVVVGVPDAAGQFAARADDGVFDGFVDQDVFVGRAAVVVEVLPVRVELVPVVAGADLLLDGECGDAFQQAGLVGVGGAGGGGGRAARAPWWWRLRRA